MLAASFVGQSAIICGATPSCWLTRNDLAYSLSFPGIGSVFPGAGDEQTVGLGEVYSCSMKS